MGKGLNIIFKTVVKEISQNLLLLGESSSEASHLISEPRNFSEVTKLLDDINKYWIKATKKEIKNLIINQTFLVKNPEKGEPVTPCMGVNKSKIQSDGSIDILKLRIVVRGDMHNKELVEDNWSPTSSTRTLKYSLIYTAKYRARVHQLDFIGSFLQ